jgi:hypothetical protein
MTPQELVCSLWGLASLPEARSGVPFFARAALYQRQAVSEGSMAYPAISCVGNAYAETESRDGSVEASVSHGHMSLKNDLVSSASNQPLEGNSPPAAIPSLYEHRALKNGAVSFGASGHSCEDGGHSTAEHVASDDCSRASEHSAEGDSPSAAAHLAPDEQGNQDAAPETMVAWVWLQRPAPELYKALVALLAALELVAGGLERPGLVLLARAFLRLGVRVQGGLRGGLEAAAAARAADMTAQQRALVSEAWLRIGCSVPREFAESAEEGVAQASLEGRDCRYV